MSKQKHPTTRAIRTLKDQGVPFKRHPYPYVDKGGTRSAAEALNVCEHLVIKTLVFEEEKGNPFLLLMHGDRQVSQKALARTLGVKRVMPSNPDTAHKHTGYVVGGVSPFGTKRTMSVHVQETIVPLPKIYINGGRRGLLVEISPLDLERLFDVNLVNVAL